MADINEELNKLMTTNDHTETYTPEDVQANKVMGVLSYLGILCLIPIFAAKESPFARFHANQGLVLCLCSIIVNVVSKVLGRIPLVGTIISLAAGLISLVVFIFAIIGIVNVCNGKAKELPVVGTIQLLK